MPPRLPLRALRRPRCATAIARALPSSARLLSAPSSARREALAAAASYKPPPPPIFSTPREDNDVRDAFDTAHVPHTTAPAGLFTFGPLTSPAALRPLAERTVVHAQAIVDRIARAPRVSPEELRLVVKNLDRLSDLLCGVIDMCELVRNAHPSQAWVAAADETYERLCSYMNGLNTDVGMYESLSATLNTPHTPPLSHAERQVALTFLRDFEKSGIDLPPAEQRKFVELSDSLVSLGRQFVSSASAGPDPEAVITIPDPERLLDGLPASFTNSLSRRRGKVLIAPGSWEAQMILRYAPQGEARRLVYVGNNASDVHRIGVLEEMLQQRAELAGVLGRENWAEVALGDKMAQNATNVWGFLSSLAEHHRASAAADVALIQKAKCAMLTGLDGEGHLPPLYAWDRDFFTERHVQALAPASLSPLSPYFSTGTVMQGLSRLFGRLYGITFKPAPVAPGEVWHESVRRLDVVHETEGPIGVIYCDVFSREGKPPNAAHYTVRCSRRVDDDDVRGDGLPAGWDAAWGPGLEVPGEHIRGKEGRYQLPVVVLTTDFGVVENGRPALLGWHEVETLFHEMGHAMHSMIGRTEYHNVSGTRCATDFVELPSILMEHFVKSPAVLGLFARHFQSGAALPLPLLESHLQLQQSFASLETHGQIVMAMLDQRYHRIAPGEALDSTAVYTDLQDRVGVIPAVDGTAWQTQFGHLYGYGATYYSYLFDRAIAGKVFATLFERDPLSRESGEALKDTLLKWGGGRDPWEMVGEVVGGQEGEDVARGDERAMEIVGGWHVQ